LLHTEIPPWEEWGLREIPGGKGHLGEPVRGTRPRRGRRLPHGFEALASSGFIIKRALMAGPGGVEEGGR